MIILFSGTGNTAYVAQMLSERLGEEIAIVPATGIVVPPEAKRVIWCFPIYSWGMPSPIRQAIASTVCGIDIVHYMVCTCGDDIGNADKQWRKAITRRGLKAAGAYAVTMPNTYVSLPGFDVDAPATVKRKLADAPVRVDEIAGSISRGDIATDVVRGRMPWVKTAVLYPLFMRYLCSAGAFHVDEHRCISCGKCSRDCPVGKISMEDDTPLWAKGACAMCLRCYHCCPARAISYGRFTRGKGQQQLWSRSRR